MGRLFWKIFAWFWGTVLAISLMSALTVKELMEHKPFHLPPPHADTLQVLLDSLGSVVRNDGPEQAREYLSKQRGPGIFQIRFTTEDGMPVSASDVPPREGQQTLGVDVVDKNGQTYQLVGWFNPPPPRELFKGSPTRDGLEEPPPRPERRLFKVWLAFGLVLSVIVCAWFAWYLSRPVKRLQVATRKFAQGHLDLRVAPEMGKRRDEISDLGHDFDEMASKLQKLIESQKRLVSDISHEFRSPLARMQVAIELARGRSKAGTHKDFDRIEREIVRLNSLVNDSLTQARLGEVPTLEKDTVNLNELISGIVADANFEAMAENKSVNFSSSEDWAIQCNKELVARALENVIRNAVLYTDNDSEVTVEATTSAEVDGGVQVSVSDQGPGVPEDQLESLFEPFSRIAFSRDRNTGGYGLGLAIAKRAVMAHGGTITAKNKNKDKDRGEGLCVCIHLPCG